MPKEEPPVFFGIETASLCHSNTVGRFGSLGLKADAESPQSFHGTFSRYTLMFGSKSMQPARLNVPGLVDLGTDTEFTLILIRCLSPDLQGRT